MSITSNEKLIQNMTNERVSNFASNSVIAKEIWNRAIEAAYQVAKETTEFAHEIRKLKK